MMGKARLGQWQITPHVHVWACNILHLHPMLWRGCGDSVAMAERKTGEAKRTNNPCERCPFGPVPGPLTGQRWRRKRLRCSRGDGADSSRRALFAVLLSPSCIPDGHPQLCLPTPGRWIIMNSSRRNTDGCEVALAALSSVCAGPQPPPPSAFSTYCITWHCPAIDQSFLP